MDRETERLRERERDKMKHRRPNNKWTEEKKKKKIIVECIIFTIDNKIRQRDKCVCRLWPGGTRDGRDDDDDNNDGTSLSSFSFSSPSRSLIRSIAPMRIHLRISSLHSEKSLITLIFVLMMAVQCSYYARCFFVPSFCFCQHQTPPSIYRSVDATACFCSCCCYAMRKSKVSDRTKIVYLHIIADEKYWIGMREVESNEEKTKSEEEK